jgi:hypothetical protein
MSSSGANGHRQLHAAIRAAQDSPDRKRVLSLQLVMLTGGLSGYQLAQIASDENVPAPCRWAVADAMVDVSPNGMAVQRNEGPDLSFLRKRGIAIPPCLNGLVVRCVTPEGRVLARGRFRHVVVDANAGCEGPTGFYRGIWHVSPLEIPEFLARFAGDPDALRWRS